ncbi:MAG: patatin family protein [Propionibacteriaceae bacterium]|nr:patatin family protein [Propionibacteriaceae bacterium]
MELRSNVTDTALVLEGGGMRGAFTAAMIATLINEGIFIDYVAGISAGSSNTVNYISRAPIRARKCFVDFADSPKFGSWKTWVQGKGLFNAQFIYEETSYPDGPLPLDYEGFMANPAQFRIGSFDAELGETIYWSREDIRDQADLLRKVRASSSIPLVMPAVHMDGRMWVDGALGLGGGIPLPIAKQDGHSKFVAILTRSRTYIKPAYQAYPFMRTIYFRHPAVADGIRNRTEQYNSTREELLELERQGKAYLIFPDQMNVSNSTRDVPALQACFDAGLEQAQRELPRLKEFLNLG